MVDYYTEHGRETLIKRLDSLITMFNTKTFPLKAYCIGFGTIEVRDRSECYARIKELSELINSPIEISKIETHLSNGDLITLDQIQLKMPNQPIKDTSTAETGGK